MKNKKEQIIEVREGQKVKFIAENGDSVIIEIKTITPEMAKDLLDTNTEDRKVVKSYVHQYARDMKNGKWRLNGSTILLSKEKKRVDGQHRLLGCVEADTPFVTLVASEIEDDAKLTVDQGKNRTLTDQIGIAGFEATVAPAIRGYLALSQKDRDEVRHEFRRVTMPELIDELNTSPELYKKAAKYAAKISKCAEIKSSVVSSSYVYLSKDLKYSEDTITDFFNQVAQLQNNSPATRALSLILNRWAKNHEGKKCPADTQRGLLIKAWNAFILGEDVDYLSYSPKVDGSVKFM